VLTIASTNTCYELGSDPGHRLGTNLNWVLVGEEVDDFEGVGNNTESKKLLAVIATLHHKANHELNTVNAAVVPALFLWARTCPPSARRWASGPS